MNKVILSCVLVALVGASAARASIICLAPTGSANGSITITAPISFTITTAASAHAFVFDKWGTSDGDRTLASISPQLAYSVNNGASGSLAAGIADNFANTGPVVTQRWLPLFYRRLRARAGRQHPDTVGGHLHHCSRQQLQPAGRPDLQRQPVRWRHQRQPNQQLQCCSGALHLAMSRSRRSERGYDGTTPAAAGGCLNPRPQHVLNALGLAERFPLAPHLPTLRLAWACKLRSA